MKILQVKVIIFYFAIVYIIPSPINKIINPTIFNIFVVSFVSFELNIFVAIFLASYIIITASKVIIIKSQRNISGLGKVLTAKLPTKSTIFFAPM